RDNMGFIWLITEKGPVRYDGNGHFKVFENLANVLRSERMFSLTKAGAESSLWAQTERAEMLLLENGRVAVTDQSYWTVFPKPTIYSASEVELVVKLPAIGPTDRPQTLCLPNSQKSCYIVSDDTVSYFSEPGAPPAFAHYFAHTNPWLFAVHRGKLVYVNRVNGYTEFRDGTPLESRKITGDLASLSDDVPFKLYWNTAADQLFIYAANNLYRIFENDQGKLSANKVLSGIDFEENKIVTVYYMQEQQQLMLGISTQGLFVAKKRLFSSVTATRRVGDNAYYLQTLLPNGLLLTDNGDAFDRSGNSLTAKQLNHHKKHYNRIIGPHGNLWVLEEESILIYDGDLSRLIRKLPNPTKAKFILSSDSANYWLGGDEGIILHYDSI